MNIGIFTDAYYPQINGVVISTRILKNELELLGHKVTIITVSDPNIKGKHEDVLRLPSIPFAVLPNFRVGSIYSYKMMKEIKKLNLDVIHTQTEFSLGIFARIVARKLNIPIVHTYHTMYEDYSHYFSFKLVDKYAKKFARKMSKVICNSVQNVVVPTKKVEVALKEYGLRKNINVIPTGVDIKPFATEGFTHTQLNETRKEVGLNETDPVLLFVGRLAKEKSISTIIEHFPSVLSVKPNTKLLIIGDGPEMDSLKKLSRTLGCEDSVVFAGKKPWETISKYYQIADIFVSASMSETQGLTYIEAMAAKKVVIAKYDTNLDDVIIDGYNGRFFRDDEELSELIIDLLQDELLSHYLAKNAAASVKEMSSEHFGKSIETIYYETVFEYSTVVFGTS